MDQQLIEIETFEEVMFFDTDCGGVVHNLAYLRMIETCRTKLAALMGMNLREMATKQLFPVLLRTEVDYKSPARLGDTLRIHGWLAGASGVRFRCEFVMTKRENPDVPLVTARQTLALVRFPEGKPMRLPGEWIRNG